MGGLSCIMRLIARHNHRDRLRTVAVRAGILPGANAIAISTAMDKWLQQEQKGWPMGYRYELGGDIQQAGKANKSIGAKVSVAGLVILLLLVA